MSKSLRLIREKFEGIHALKEEWMLRFALLGHTRPTDHKHMEMMVELIKINREIEGCSRQVRKIPVGTPEEDVCLEKLHQLEDARFQILSDLNGEHIAEYNILSPVFKPKHP